jgi:ribonuclease-3
MARSDVAEEVSLARGRLERMLAPIIGEGEVPRLAEALTHSSFANESAAEDNQRLEFLGDAVLGVCVTEALLEEHPLAGEGELTRMRAALVCATALARWGREACIGECLAMGRGARSTTEREQPNVLADAVEALIAAVYLARGIDGARRLVQDVTGAGRVGAAELASLDPKSALQETVQADGERAPRYRVVGSSGPPHEPSFEVEVIVGEAVVARGEGRSKRLAERAAAEAALVARAALATDAAAPDAPSSSRGERCAPPETAAPPLPDASSSPRPPSSG